MCITAYEVKYLLLRLSDLCLREASLSVGVGRGIANFMWSVFVPLDTIECKIQSLIKRDGMMQTCCRLGNKLYLPYKMRAVTANHHFGLRHTAGGYGFRGNYDGTTSGNSFNGIAVDELLLVKAECAVRLGDRALALLTLNQLLEKRMVKGTFVPVTAGSDTEIYSWYCQSAERNWWDVAYDGMI